MSGAREVAAFAAALVLVSTGPVLAAGASARACRMLEPDDIASAFAASEVSEGEKGEIAGTCLWQVDGGPESGGGVIATALDEGRSARRSFRAARGLAGRDVVEVEGIGRAAFFAIDTVYVLRTKRSFFYVQGLFPTSTPSATDLQVDLETLARVAVDRV